MYFYLFLFIQAIYILNISDLANPIILKTYVYPLQGKIRGIEMVRNETLLITSE